MFHIYIGIGIVIVLICIILFRIDIKREYFENKISNKPHENFHIIINALLDNSILGDKIVQEYSIKSMEELLQYNLESKTIHSAVLLSPYQENLIKTYIKYRDYYYIDKPESQIVPIVRKNIGKLPHTFLDDDAKLLSLNLFRRNIYYYYDVYSKKDDFITKTQWINKYIGLKDINYYINLLRENNKDNEQWFGIKYLESIPNRICVYNPETNIYYHNNNNILIQFKLRGDFKNNFTNFTNSPFIKTLNNLQETLDMDLHREYFDNIMLQNIDIMKYTKDFNDLITNKTSSFFDNVSNVQSVPAGNFLFVFTQNTTYTIDILTKILTDLNSHDNTLLASNGIDNQNIQYWVQNLDMNDSLKLLYLRNILRSYLNKIINSYMDLLAIVVYFNITDVTELVDVNPEYKFDGYWSNSDLNGITKTVLQIGYCGVNGTFKITSTKKAWYFIYNNSNYYDYWTPVEVYIKQMNNSISIGLQLNDLSLIRSIAKFCYFNNKSFIDYLKEGARCDNDICNDVNVDNLYEPQRCQSLKDKYVELMKTINTDECMQLKKTGKVNPDILNLMLLDVMELTLKLRKCQMDFVIPSKNCIDNEQNWRTINTMDQPTDTDLSIIQPDKSHVSRMYDDDQTYDQYNKQIDDYKKLLYSFEKIELDKLNSAANNFEPNRGYGQMTMSNFGGFLSSGVSNIITDLANYNIKDTKTQSVITNPNDPFNIKDNNKPKKQNNLVNNIWEKIMPKNKINRNNNIVEHFTVPQGDNLWEPKDENNLENPKNSNNTNNTNNVIKNNQNNRSNEAINDEKEFKRIAKALKDSVYFDKVDSGVFNMIYYMFNYVMGIVEILTRDDRIMFSGFILLFISFGLYFIDITS